MFDVDDLKTITRQLVIESDKFTDTKKVKLIKFIDESAEEEHLNVILSDSDYLGECEDNFLNEISVTMVGGKIIVWGPGGITSISTLGAAAIAAALIIGSNKIYKTFFSKSAKACNHFSVGSDQRKQCENKFKKQAFKEQIKILTASKAECKKSKDVAKCSKKVDEKIKKLKSKLSALG